jgi:small GTP-binding protein
MSEERGFVFKINVIGDQAVGKTSLIKKYTQGSFQKEYIKTIGAQFSKYDEEIEGQNCRLFFWDIAGQKEFSFMREAFYQGSKAAIIVFSQEENELGEESIKNIKEWYDNITQYCGKIPIVLFGNKIDLINDENARDSKINEIVEQCNLLGYYKTSAKTGAGVYGGFQAIIRELYHRYKHS